jgi:ATP-dependent exoDNAse (exonuclease V) beta subunit
MSLSVYKSSAGSGKTYTLVLEYLILVISQPHKYREVLALTFTNKAAAEMKHRILLYLVLLTNNLETVFTKRLRAVIMEKTSLNCDEINKRVVKVLGLILHNYSDFAIGTIDSFAHKIVRTFSHDMFLPVNFEVEMDTDELLNQAVDLLINSAGIDDALTGILVEYVENETEEEKNWNIEKSLVQFSSTLFKEDGYHHIDKMRNLSISDFAKTKQGISRFMKGFENQISRYANEASSLIRSKKLTHEVFYQKSKGVLNYFERLAEMKMDKIEPNSYVKLAFNDNNWVTASVSQKDRAALDSIKPELKGIYEEMQKIIAVNYKKYLLAGLISTKIYALALLHEVKRKLEELKKRDAIVLISDFNKQISDIVLNEPVPYIYERIGEKYKNYFIDEFQDTSIIQWQNLLPLIDNSLSEDELNLIVGDAKQAIYRWRNGAVEQFAKLPDIYGVERTNITEEREKTLRRNYTEQDLRMNFRSAFEIVQFNNEFFETIKAILPETVKSIYDNHSQMPKESREGGYVSIEFLSGPEDDAETYSDQTNKKIMQTIQSLTEDGFQYRDIAILCRANDNANNIARFLIKNGISVVSSESLLLKSSPEVIFIIACLLHLNNEADPVPLFAMFNYLKCNGKTGFSESTIDQFYKEKYYVNKAFQEVIRKFIPDYNGKRLKKLMIYELCEELIRIFKLDNRKDPYLIAFLDNVIKYSLKKSNNLADFLEWWKVQNQKLSIITPDGTNAVRISTIHKAKGLEFPAVIHPYAKGSIRKTRSNTWIDLNNEEPYNLPAALVNISEKLSKAGYSDLVDEENAKSYLDVVNLLYVTFTRPSERLYIFSVMAKEEKENKKETKMPKEFKRPGDISKLLNYFLEEKGVYEEHRTNYSFGNKTRYSPGIAASIEKEDYTDALITDNIRDKVFIKSIFDKTDLSSKFEENLLWGNIFHDVLSEVYSSENIEKAVDKYFSNQLLNDHYREIVMNKLKWLVSDERLKPYFCKGLKVVNEAEFICDDGKILRPDRIVFNGNALTIIDYKTGKLRDSHIRQINEYAKALESMNYTIAEKLLVNISSGIVELVA